MLHMMDITSLSLRDALVVRLEGYGRVSSSTHNRQRITSSCTERIFSLFGIMHSLSLIMPINLWVPSHLGRGTPAMYMPSPSSRSGDNAQIATNLLEGAYSDHRIVKGRVVELKV